MPLINRCIVNYWQVLLILSTAFSASWSPKSTSFFIHVVNMNMSIVDTHAFTWEKTISPSIYIDAHRFTPLGITLHKIVVEGVPIRNFPADYPIYYLFNQYIWACFISLLWSNSYKGLPAFRCVIQYIFLCKGSMI